MKGCYHDNEIMLPWWRQTDTTCILCTFARWKHGLGSLLLAGGGGTAAPSGLLARLCHAFLVSCELSDSERPSANALVSSLQTNEVKTERSSCVASVHARHHVCAWNALSTKDASYIPTVSATTRNVWQSLAYSPLGAVVSPPSR